MKVEMELWIYSASKKMMYSPPIQEGVTWTTEREGTPGQLEFKVVKDKTLSFSEGDAVRLQVNGHKIFYGFVFKKKMDKDKIITVTAYDQLRYLKNKDTYVYKGKTAGQVIKMIAKDFNLQTGTIADTKYKIPSRVEDNSTLFDIIQNALDLTLQHKNKRDVMYDDFGKITLKNLSDMKVHKGDDYLLITDESAENYDYSSSIDDSTYNQIKLVYKNQDTGKSEVYMAKSTKNINKWGVLQKYDTLQKDENGKDKANALLNLYNSPTKKLQIKNVKGDYRVRAGSLILVSMTVGGNKINNFMLVEKCKHEWKESQHLMTLTLKGGAINA